MPELFVEKLSDYYRRAAEAEDAIPQPPFLADPEAVLADEADFDAWLGGRGGCLVTAFVAWFRERTGCRVCAGFRDSFGYRPRDTRDAAGVWRTWGKYPKWFSKRLHLDREG